MLATLRTNAPAGVTLTGVDGAVTTAPSRPPAPRAQRGPRRRRVPVAQPAGLQQVGTLTLTGTARDERSVADYADSLAHVKGLALAVRHQRDARPERHASPSASPSSSPPTPSAAASRTARSAHDVEPTATEGH